MEVFRTAFLFLQFVFVIFWQKKIGEKGAHTKLVKVTEGGRKKEGPLV